MITRVIKSLFPGNEETMTERHVISAREKGCEVCPKHLKSRSRLSRRELGNRSEEEAEKYGILVKQPRILHKPGSAPDWPTTAETKHLPARRLLHIR